MIIRNYGLFWRRNKVHWGTGGNLGHLQGVLASNITSDPINFRHQIGVYALYDDNFNLVYVGQAGSGDSDLFSRLKQHKRNRLAERWERFSWFGIRKVNSNGMLAEGGVSKNIMVKDALNHMEAILIEVTEPSHNRQGGRFGDCADQYLQYDDPNNVYPGLESMVRDLWDSLPEDDT